MKKRNLNFSSFLLNALRAAEAPKTHDFHSWTKAEQTFFEYVASLPRDTILYLDGLLLVYHDSENKLRGSVSTFQLDYDWHKALEHAVFVYGMAQDDSDTGMEDGCIA